MRHNSSNSQTSGRIILAVTILGSSMAFIDGTVVNVALPALQNAFHASIADVQWVVESYALMLAALLLVGGSLGDIFGRRKIYVIGVAIFAAASAWCGMARTIDTLILARSLQGIGAALLVPGSLAIITASYPEETRGRAIGTWSGFTAITAAIGPVIGGWLIEYHSWRWVFFLNLPLALAVVLLSAKVPESRNEQASHHLDWPGALLVTLGLGGVTYALIEWPSRTLHRGNFVVIAAFAGTAALAGFIAVEHYSRLPMVSLSLFRSRNFTGANLLTLFLYASLGGLMFFFPMDLIQIQHYTATQAGAAFLPFVAVMAISVAPLTTTVMNAVPDTESGLASGINNAVSRLASLLAVAVFGAILVTVFNHTLTQSLNQLAPPPNIRAQIDAARPLLAAAHNPNPTIQQAITESFITGYHTVIWIAAALAALSAIAAWLIIQPAASTTAKSV